METTHGFKWEKTFGAVSAPKCLISVQQHNISLLSLGVFSYFPSLTSRSGVDAAQQVLPRTRAMRCAAWLAFSWLNEAKSSLGNRLTLREREKKKHPRKEKEKWEKLAKWRAERKGNEHYAQRCHYKAIKVFRNRPERTGKERARRPAMFLSRKRVCVCVCVQHAIAFAE